MKHNNIWFKNSGNQQITRYHTDILYNKIIQQYIDKIHIDGDQLYIENIINNNYIDNLFSNLYIYQTLLSIVEKNGNRFVYNNYRGYYNISVKKMKQFGLLPKLFYFDLIKKYDEKFIEYFKQFIEIFIKYDGKIYWQKHNVGFISRGSLNFMQEYLDYYKYKTNEDVSQFQNKLTFMLQSNDYSYIGDNSLIFLNI